MNKPTLALLILLLAAGGLMWIWTTTAPEALVIDQARIRLTPGNGPQAGYFTLQNHTSKTITLQAASSPAFGRVMLHETRNQDGQSSMHHLDGGVRATPGESIEFAPGGMHLMLMNGQQTLQVGDSIPVVLGIAVDGEPAQSLSYDFTVVPLTP